ncbi:MAG: VOC family protein [Actinomycetota bacterium]
MISGLDHVQLAIPGGGEDKARAFYGSVLGMTEVDKPEQLRANGGLWFEAPGVQLHLGIEEPFTPARKAHVALLVSFADVVLALAEGGWQVDMDPRIPDRLRAYTADPFGNRIELIADGDGFSQRG